MTKIKNCGLTTEEAIHEAARTGAHYIGLVHHLASPRHLEIGAMAKLYSTVPDSLQTVIVLVDPSFDLLDEILTQVRPHFWQVHRVNDPARVAQITQHTGIPVITAISVRDRNNLIAAEALEGPSAHVLFDTYNPHQEGGSGEVFDWSLLQLLRPSKPWFLAGGLTPHNVADAVRATHAPMVDVSSGIEASPGIKSLEKIAAFNEAVLEAAR